MSFDARLILKRASNAERWEQQERGDYNLERFDREFREQLFSDRGREILQPQARQSSPKREEPKER
jgi:hypothetical protein